jgi:hypothetical protein
MMDIKRTIEHVVGVIDAASERRDPFHHLRVAVFFPPEVYAAMMDAMPAPERYGAMSGRARLARASDGGSARMRIDLFPEGLIRQPAERRLLWGAIGEVLRSTQVQEAWRRRLAPALEERFGPRHAAVRMYSVPILVRDVPGYRIGVHTDTPRKGITAQIYLPRDDSTAHIGTIFHERDSAGALRTKDRVAFEPNTGYAFAVGADTFHSVDSVGPEVRSRDSILLNYFVDDSWLRVAQNRSKRMGHLIRGMGWRRTGATREDKT